METYPHLEAAPDNGPPYPSYRELAGNFHRVNFSPAVKRLFWPFDGVFPAEICVMKSPRSAADNLEPYFKETDGGDGIWHEIAQMPLTEPKVSSIEASSYDLEQWEYDWVAWHDCHSDSEYVAYGDLDDEDRPYANEMKEDGSWEEDSETEFLTRCCGQDRPLRKRGQKLRVTPASGNNFVTVHDWVSAVHPWLMGLRSDIFLRKNVARRPVAYPKPAEMEWMVDLAIGYGPSLQLEEKKEWIQRHGGPRPPVPASVLAAMERMRAQKRAEQAVGS
ncbi:hypothetical protein B0H66DRAFT_615498 [Apodospora peruviana]|uniref:Uncharacterized protein n=1 Tax=Apodospora peruviana TaxID=516989 RepID=A0AAE0MA59_9PEZI|nr:hypothetical protein B0H66DRAFT_615498 [Apodospora peruviana]